MFNKKNEQILIKDGKIYLGEILLKVDYLKKKNIEAKSIITEIIESLKKKILEWEAKIPSSNFLTEKKVKEHIKDLKEGIKNFKEYLNNIEIPDNFYSDDNRFEFYNDFYNHFYISKNIMRIDKEWKINLDEEVVKTKKDVMLKLNKLLHDDYLFLYNKDISYIKNKDYDKDYGYEKVDGFDLVFLDVKNNVYYNKSLDKSNFNIFLNELDGKKLNRRELEEEVEKRKELFNKKIADYPHSKEILKKFYELQGRYNGFKGNDWIILRKKNYHHDNIL